MAGRLPIIQPASLPRVDVPDELRGRGARVHLVSLGCPKNRTDSEAMLAALGQAGWEFAPAAEGADLVIVNTCTFIDDATTESIDAVLEMAGLRQAGKVGRLVVAGCMAQRHHRELRREMPEVDAFVGTGDYHRIVEVAAPGRPALDRVGPPAWVQGAEARVNTLGPWSAYLKILEGCPRRCTFCVIPLLRGDLHSRSRQVLVEEASALAAAGVKELNLVGQDSNSWGRDLEGRQRLPDLLAALDAVPGIDWIRVLYSHPDGFDDRLIAAFADLPRVVRYVDMPLQHVAPPILRAMKRGAGRARTEALLRELRDRIPGLSLRTAFIVGFPGETDRQFDDLCEFVREQRFDNLGVFTFSAQDETPAATLPRQVPQDVREQRREHLMLLQQEIVLQRNEERVGDVVDVLIEGPHPESPDLLWVGRTRGQAPEIDGQVIVTDAGGASFGDIVPMRVVQAAGYDLVAEAVSPRGWRSP